MSSTNQQIQAPAPNNSSLEAILKSVGVNCSKCMMSRIRMLRTPAQREGYFRALRMSAEQIEAAERELSGRA